MKTLIFLILTSVLVLTVLNTVYLRRIYKLNKGKKSSINDDRYFEIKYKFQLYAIVFSLIIATASFFGLDKYNEFNKLLDSQIKGKISSYDSVLVNIDSTLKGVEQFIDNFSVEKEAIKTILLKAGSDAKTIEKSINILASRKVNMPNIYVVKDIKIKIDEKGYERQRIYYRDLKTFDGRSLPKFKKPPFVNIPSNYSVEPKMTENTNDYFEIYTSGWTKFEDFDYSLVDIWILSDE